MATPIKSPHQSSDPAYLVKCLSPLPNRYPDRCMSAQIYRRPAPRRSNGFMRRRINRSLSLEILNNRSEQSSPNNQKINNDSVRHSRSAKILKALNIEYNIKSSKKSIREKLNFDGTPSSKSSSPINLRIDSNESLATSVNDTSAESIDENQNRTPSRRSTGGGGGGVKKSLNYESPMNDFKALSPMLRSELKKKIDDIVLTNATPLKSIGRTRRSEPVVASTPRNLYDDLGDEDERRRIGHKKNLPGCSTDISPTLSTEMETDDSQEIPIQRTLNFSISSETHYDDEFAETGSLYDYSTVESLDDIASVAKTSKSDDVYSINSSKSEKFHSIIDDKSDNNDKQLNDNEKLCKKIKRKSESDNEECPSTPENSINYIQKIMTDSIKKSHKKVKEIHKKSLLRSQIFEKNMDNSPNIKIYDKLENSPRITRSSLKYYKNINNLVINNGKSSRKTQENERKIDISDASESEEYSKNTSNENYKKIGKLLDMEIPEDESSEKPRKSRNSIGKSRENLLRPKRMEFGEENSGKSLENSGKSLEKMEMSEKSMENSEKSSDSRVGTPEQLNSSRLLLSQFDSVKKSHKKDKHRKLGFTQRNLNSNDSSNDDTNNLSNFLTPNKRTSPHSKPNDSETFNSTPISSKKSLKNTLNMIPIVRVERMADYEDELEKYETGSENDEKMETIQKSKKNSIRFSAESSPLENLESTFSSENSQKTYDTETSPSTPANSEKLDISSLSSIKKSHKKHKRVSSCKRLLIETDDVDKDSDDNVEDTKGNNDEVLTTPPNTLAIKNHLRLMQSTSIKRSHKKIREKKKQDRLIFYSNLAEVKPLEEPRRRRRCLGGDK